MHEVGMLYQTARIADDYAEKNDFSEVGCISIDVGELSGALPEIFTEYFEFVASNYPRLKSAKLDIHIVAGEGLCADCNCLYNVIRNEGRCPRCGSQNKKILGGTEVKLRSIAGA